MPELNIQFGPRHSANGWEQSNDGDVQITISRNSSAPQVEYTVHSIKMNLGKGNGSVYSATGHIIEGRSSSTIQAFFCEGSSASTSANAITNLVYITNPVSIKVAGTSTSSGYFKPSNSQYEFVFTGDGLTIPASGSRTITLCKSVTSNDILSWANTELTPPELNYHAASVPDPSSITVQTDTTTTLRTLFMTGDCLRAVATASTGILEYQYRYKGLNEEYWSNWSSYTSYVNITSAMDAIQFRARARVGTSYSNWLESSVVSRLTATPPEVSLSESALIGTSASPTISLAPVTNAVSGTTTYQWFRKTRNAQGSETEYAEVTNLQTTFSSSLSKATYRVIARIVDSVNDNIYVETDPIEVSCTGKLKPDTSIEYVVGGIVGESSASAGETLSCIVSGSSGNPATAIPYYKLDYYKLVGSTEVTKIIFDWSTSPTLSEGILTRPDNYSSVMYSSKRCHPYYIDSDEIKSLEMPINYAPRRVDQYRVTDIDPTISWSITSGAQYNFNDSITITIPGIPQSGLPAGSGSRLHNGYFNYYEIVAIPSNPSSISRAISAGFANSTSSSPQVVTINFNNNVKYFSENVGSGESCKLRLNLKYYDTANNGTIDDVPPIDIGLNSTYYESESFYISASVGDITATQLIPDPSLPDLERVTYNEYPLIMYTFNYTTSKTIVSLDFSIDSSTSPDVTDHYVLNISYDATTGDPIITPSIPTDPDIPGRYHLSGLICDLQFNPRSSISDDYVGSFVVRPRINVRTFTKNISLVITDSASGSTTLSSNITYKNTLNWIVSGSQILASDISELYNDIIKLSKVYKVVSAPESRTAQDFLGKLCSPQPSSNAGYVNFPLFQREDPNISNSITDVLYEVVNSMSMNLESCAASAFWHTLGVPEILNNLGGSSAPALGLIITRLRSIADPSSTQGTLIEIKNYNDSKPSQSLGRFYGSILSIVKYIL